MGPLVAAPEFFFCGGHRRAKCDSEGRKIQKFAENGWFWPLFLLTGGQVDGGRASDWGGISPMPPLDAATGDPLLSEA